MGLMWQDGQRRTDVTRALSILVSLLLTMGTVVQARAQDPLGPDPVASDLFRQGRSLISDGDWEAGCAKLELSMKRFAAPSTLMNIARCREHEGRVATAWALYRRALVLNLETKGDARRQELEEVAKEAIADLEPRLPRIRVVLARPVRGAVVREHGRELPFDTAVPLDPGTVQLTGKAPGHADLHEDVTLVEGKTTTVQVEFVKKPDAPTSPEEDEVVEAPVPVWVWLLGGTGVAMAGVAVGFGVDAWQTNDALLERCGDDQRCDEDPDFDPEPDNARKNRGLALSIGFGVGALGALTAAAVGLLTHAEPSAPTVAPMLLPEGAGLSLRARF